MTNFNLNDFFTDTQLEQMKTETKASEQELDQTDINELLDRLNETDIDELMNDLDKMDIEELMDRLNETDIDELMNDETE